MAGQATRLFFERGIVGAAQVMVYRGAGRIRRKIGITLGGEQIVINKFL